MKRCIALILLLVVLFVSCAGCLNDTKKETHPSFKFLPNIKDFSSTVLESAADYWGAEAIDSAVLIQDGKESPISPEYARLIRLLNAISYSWHQGESVYITGDLTSAEVGACESSDSPALVVYFNSQTGWRAQARIVSNSILLYTDFTQNKITDPEEAADWNEFLLLMEEYVYQEKYFVTQHWPFSVRLEKTYGAEAVRKSRTAWADDTYLDLLDYVGF